LFGLAPALQSTRPALVPALKELSRLPRNRLSQALVVGQIALLMLMLMGAGLFVRTLSNLQSVPLGFNRDNLLLFELNAPQAGRPASEVAAFYAGLQDRIAGIPGVPCCSMASRPRERDFSRPVRDSFRRCRFRCCRAGSSTSAIAPGHCRSRS
jgi:macrolide transport system ATP-binding/permease protein